MSHSGTQSGTKADQDKDSALWFEPPGSLPNQLRDLGQICVPVVPRFPHLENGIIAVPTNFILLL